MLDSSKIQSHIAFTDLREWIVEADKFGELKTVRGAQRQRSRPASSNRGLRYFV